MSLRFLLAHGAGAPSSSSGMYRLAELLGRLGTVRSFDYPYMRAKVGGARKPPDKLEALIAAHRAELSELRASSERGDKLVLSGRSMGGRVGCHVALVERIDALVCFGYPLRGQNGKLRDQVLLELQTPILFVQGTRDELCSLSELDDVRKRMSAPSELFVVEGGNHSLDVTKTELKARGATSADVDEAIQSAVARFCSSL